MIRRVLKSLPARLFAIVAIAGMAVVIQSERRTANAQYPQPAPAAPAYYQPPPTFFAQNLGIYYVFEPYFNTQAIRLVAYPIQGSPAFQIGLVPGDRIVNLDGLPLFTPDDVLSHRAWTTVQFLHVYSQIPDSATVFIP